jgi:hypothetical protein
MNWTCQNKTKCKRSIKPCLMHDLKEYHYFCEKMEATTDFSKKTAYSKYLKKWQSRLINCKTLNESTILPPMWEQFYLKICAGITKLGDIPPYDPAVNWRLEHQNAINQLSRIIDINNVKDNNEITSSIGMEITDTSSNLSVLKKDRKLLSSINEFSFSIAKKDSEVMSSRVDIKNHSTNKSSSSITSNVKNSNEIPSSITSNVKDSTEIPSSITSSVKDSTEIPSSITNTGKGNNEIPSSITSYIKDSNEIPSSITNTVKDNNEIPSSITNTVKDNNKISSSVTKPSWTINLPIQKKSNKASNTNKGRSTNKFIARRFDKSSSIFLSQSDLRKIGLKFLTNKK